MHQSRTGFLGCVHLGTQGRGPPCQHEPLWPLNSPHLQLLGNHKALPFTGAQVSWTNYMRPVSRGRLVTVPTSPPKRASKWVQKSGHPAPSIRRKMTHRGSKQQMKWDNWTKPNQDSTNQWPTEFNPSATKFNKTGTKPTENAKCINGHHQLDYHKPEFTGVICVQSGVLPSQQTAKTIGQNQVQASNQTKQ